MYITPNSYGDGTIGEFFEFLLNIITAPIRLTLRKLFPKAFPASKPLSTQYVVTAEDIEIQTADNKTFVCTVNCRVSCPANKINYDKSREAITMALKVVGSSMTYDEIIHGLKTLLEGAMKWDKMPELLGEDVELYTTSIFPITNS